MKKTKNNNIKEYADEVDNILNEYYYFDEDFEKHLKKQSKEFDKIIEKAYPDLDVNFMKF